MPVVSFLVPVFNKARFLPSVLRALDRQSGTFGRELIIVDDGSTDESPRILAEYARGRADVRLIRLEDEGPAVALNAAAALASGDYLKPVDADDLLAPNCVELLLDAAESQNAVLAFGGSRIYQAEKLPDVDLPPASRAPVRRLDKPLANLLRYIPALSGCLIRADAFRRVGGCDERVFVHDMPLLYRLALDGAFAQVEAELIAMPEQDPTRWSNRNLGQVLHDVNLALYWLLREHPEIDRPFRRRAFHRCAGRAWKWARRHGGHGLASSYFALNLLSYLPVPFGHARLIGGTLGAFRGGGTVRRGRPAMHDAATSAEG
jgi:glycosyltransferase involved in cell wall biosynthesis